MINISKDVQRFRNIIKGKIKENLKKYMSSDEIITRQGKEFISIPIPQIELPRFKFNSQNSGIGQGEADIGDRAGDQESSNILELEVTIDELADILGSELELPRIIPKGKKEIIIDSTKYTGLRRVGPESLKSFKHTFRESLKRQIASGSYDYSNPLIVPIKDDKRYRVSMPISKPHSQAIIFYMMDISGSMDDQKKLLARLISFWIDTWLRKNYKHLEYKYLVHNIRAWEVPKEDFYRIREGGGTYIYSTYELCQKIILENYSPIEWNIYIFHFSDGDDMSDILSERAIRIIKEMVPMINQISYCQILDSDKFLTLFNNKLKLYPQVVSHHVETKADVYDAIKTFFSKGN